MEIIRRSRLFVLLPNAILGFLCLNLIWDFIKMNLNSEAGEQWPWRFNLLDVATCATLVGITAGLILTRAQFSKSVRPAIGWAGHEVEKSSTIPGAVWTVFLQNHGPGNCRIRRIEYSYQLVGRAASGWKTWDEVVGELADAEIVRSRDYHLSATIVGATIWVDSTSHPNSELAAFTNECLAKLASMDVLLEVEDALGDTYGRTIECLHTAHKITAFREAAATITKKSRFRKHRQ